MAHRPNPRDQVGTIDTFSGVPKVKEVAPVFDTKVETATPSPFVAPEIIEQEVHEGRVNISASALEVPETLEEEVTEEEVTEEETPEDVAPEDVAPEEKVTETPEDDRPAGNASGPVWHEYRLAHGYTAEELEGMGRDALRDLADR
jgi:hypothetical protein